MYTEEDLKQLAVEMDQIQYCDVTTAKQLVAEVIRLREALEEISESWMCTASPGSFNVNANTTYWIQVTSIGGGPGDSNYLSITSNTAETGSPGWSLGDSHLYTYYGSSPQVYVGNPILMEISGVPEPSSASMLILGLGGMIPFLRRRR